MKYRIFDLRNGLLADNVFVEAKNPKEALLLTGYKNIQRDVTGTGNIVVYGNRGSYIYNAIRGNEK